VADEGGATSHGANLLREFGVPAVISTGHGTERLRDGMVVTVDGFRGNVYAGDLSVGPQTLGRVPATTTKVFASVLVPEKAEVVAALADGVSSLRNDYFLLKGDIHPLEAIRCGQAEELEETLYRGICRTAEVFAGKPLWYKTMDAPTDEFRRLAGGEHEPLERNPLLGWRGIGRELDEPEMFAVEVRAVARAVARGHEHIGIKLPFIRFVSEFERARAAVRRAGLDPVRDVELGISVETPAVALELSRFLDAGAAFVSVGVSDLTMCTLAVDRESHRVAGSFDPAAPAVVELLRHIVLTSREAGVFVCATGESARDDALLPHLVRMRVDAIGVSPAYFAEVKRRIHQIELADR
jgi:pyruvate,water dikinase